MIRLLTASISFCCLSYSISSFDLSKEIKIDKAKLTKAVIKKTFEINRNPANKDIIDAMPESFAIIKAKIASLILAGNASNPSGVLDCVFMCYITRCLSFLNSVNASHKSFKSDSLKCP